MPEIVVVMHSNSAVAFRPGQALALADVRCPAGRVQVTYRTNWVSTREKVDIPNTLEIEIAGEAANLETALSPFGNAGLCGVVALSLAANAGIDEPSIELGFDRTPGKTQRDFFQAYVPPREPVLRSVRFLDREATADLLGAMESHSESSRLYRAANQYRLALAYWHYGRESLSVAHLWMAVEALTKAKVRAECRRRGLATQAELARDLNVELGSLDPTVRERLILNEDHECYSLAKKASDSFEHGFQDFSAIRGLSRTVRDRMAAHVRQAILGLVFEEAAGEQTRVLASDRFSTPLGCWPIVKYARGKIIGTGDNLAPNQQRYPSLGWTAMVDSARINDEGQLEVDVREKIHPQFGDGLAFQLESAEVWRPG